jgi:hypothetical protein
MRASEEDSGMLARAIVRLAMSYVSMPPEADHDVAADLARLMTPAAERYGELRDDSGLGPEEERSHRLEREDFEAGVRGGTTGEAGEVKE